MKWGAKEVMKRVTINTESIQLDQLLKWANVAYSGGEAKQMIQSGIVFVNGKKETQSSQDCARGPDYSSGPRRICSCWPLRKCGLKLFS